MTENDSKPLFLTDSKRPRTELVIIGLIIYTLCALLVMAFLAIREVAIPSELSISLSTTVGALCGAAANSSKPK